MPYRRIHSSWHALQLVRQHMSLQQVERHAYSGLAAASHDFRSVNRQDGYERSAAKPSLAGVWKRDMSVSDSYKPVSDEFELSFAARQGVKLANTLVIEEDAGTFTTKVKVRWHAASCLSQWRGRQRPPLYWL